VQVSNRDLESFYNFCLERPQGATVEELNAAGWKDNGQIMACANPLLAHGRLELIQLGGKRLLYKAVDPQTVQKFRGLDKHHLLVYQLIEKAGNQGAWSRSLKDRSNLQTHTITRVTQELLKRNLIKEVKSVQNRTRKVFMLIDVEPAKEVSGGTWYQDGVFAEGWVNGLREQCREHMSQNSDRLVTLDDLYDKISSQPIAGATKSATKENVEAIMRTLELEEEVHVVEDRSVTGGEKAYCMIQRGINSGPFDIFAARLPSFITNEEPQRAQLSIPCLSCPLQDACCPGGRICPERCEYLAAWLPSLKGGAQPTPMEW